jgi:hypothetical protein
VVKEVGTQIRKLAILFQSTVESLQNGMSYGDGGVFLATASYQPSVLGSQVAILRVAVQAACTRARFTQRLPSAMRRFPALSSLPNKPWVIGERA